VKTADTAVEIRGWNLDNTLLGNDSVNTFPKNTLSTMEGHPLLGNGQINKHS
jgi:hypothetical protein